MKRNEIIAVLGHKGCGKSWIMARHLEEQRRFAVWDPASTFAGPYAENKVHNATLYRTAGDHLRAVAEHGHVGRSVIQAPRESFLPWLSAMTKVADCCIAIDELSLFCSPHKKPAALLELVRIGRHRRIDQLYSARRPAEVPRDVTAQADFLIVGRTFEPTDTDYLKAFCGEKLAEHAKNLSPRVFVTFKPGEEWHGAKQRTGARGGRKGRARAKPR